MAVSHYTVTLNGSAQQLSSQISGMGSIIKSISIQAAAGNAHVAYVGGSNATLTSGNYGFIVPIPVTSIPAAPQVLTFDVGALSFGDIYVLGTNGEKLQILVVT